MNIQLTINGRTRAFDVDPRQRLSEFIRETLGLTGLKEGCREGECGACTVLVDDSAVNSCLMLAFQADGRRIVTIEGLKTPEGDLSPLQRAFVDHGAVQCGYCTPGMIMAAEGLLRQNPAPSDAEIRHALAGNLCRCTGFQTIVAAVRSQAPAPAFEGPAANHPSPSPCLSPQAGRGEDEAPPRPSPRLRGEGRVRGRGSFRAVAEKRGRHSREPGE
ncbi:MAG: (2Fe-2S)-binding protein [Roseiarcus sp.]|jgi:aerobic-type carbon monoxide dehydrogenase small subunit (CoxS/CutS family)